MHHSSIISVTLLQFDAVETAHDITEMVLSYCMCSVCRHMSFVIAYARLFADVCAVSYTPEVTDALLTQYLFRFAHLTSPCLSARWHCFSIVLH